MFWEVHSTVWSSYFKNFTKEMHLIGSKRQHVAQKISKDLTKSHSSGKSFPRILTNVRHLPEVRTADSYNIYILFNFQFQFQVSNNLIYIIYVKNINLIVSQNQHLLRIYIFEKANHLII